MRRSLTVYSSQPREVLFWACYSPRKDSYKVSVLRPDRGKIEILQEFRMMRDTRRIL